MHAGVQSCLCTSVLMCNRVSKYMNMSEAMHVSKCVCMCDCMPTCAVCAVCSIETCERVCARVRTRVRCGCPVSQSSQKDIWSPAAYEDPLPPLSMLVPRWDPAYVLSLCLFLRAAPTAMRSDPFDIPCHGHTLPYDIGPIRMFAPAASQRSVRGANESGTSTLSSQLAHHPEPSYF